MVLLGGHLGFVQPFSTGSRTNAMKFSKSTPSSFVATFKRYDIQPSCAETNVTHRPPSYFNRLTAVTRPAIVSFRIGKEVMSADFSLISNAAPNVESVTVVGGPRGPIGAVGAARLMDGPHVRFALPS